MVMETRVVNAAGQDSKMKILCISDDEIYDLWDGWTSKNAEKYADIDMVISAGDLRAKYLEFIVTVLNVPLLYVRGNHDEMYEFVMSSNISHPGDVPLERIFAFRRKPNRVVWTKDEFREKVREGVVSESDVIQMADGFVPPQDMFT